MGVVDELNTKMYLTLAVFFALAFALLLFFLGFFGVSANGTLLLTLIFFGIQWYVSPFIISWMSNLRYIKDNEMPELHALVRQLAMQANVSAPRIAVSPSLSPNAFVFGRTRKGATLVVHQGLLNIVNNDELRAVLSHEIGHIKHNDFVIIMILSFIPSLAYIIFRNSFFARSEKRDGGQIILFALGAFLVYLISEFLVLSFSRARESYADIYSAEATNHPEHLASALVKITYNLADKPDPQNAANRTFYIADGVNAGKDVKEIEQHAPEIRRLLPNLDLGRFRQAAYNETHGFMSFLSIYSTHPPTYKRIIDLARMKK